MAMGIYLQKFHNISPEEMKISDQSMKYICENVSDCYNNSNVYQVHEMFVIFAILSAKLLSPTKNP